MKLKVLKAFGDHHENCIRQVGETFEVTKQRFEELSLKLPDDYFEQVKTTKTKEK